VDQNTATEVNMPACIVTPIDPATYHYDISQKRSGSMVLS